MLHLEYSSCFASNQQTIRNIFWHDLVTIFFSLSNSLFILWFVVVVEFWEWKGHWTDDGNGRELSLQYFPIFPLFWDWDKLVIRNLTRYKFLDYLGNTRRGKVFPIQITSCFTSNIIKCKNNLENIHARK